MDVHNSSPWIKVVQETKISLNENVISILHNKRKVTL